MNSAPVTRTLAIVCACIAFCLCNPPMVSAGTITIDEYNSPIQDVFPPPPPPYVVNIVEGAVVERNVYGHPIDDPTIGNTINISGGSIRVNVYGGKYSGDVTGSNFINVTGGAIGNDVYGVYTTSGHIQDSTEVHISGGTIGGGVYGAYAEQSGNVTANSILIEDDPAIIGGTTINSAYGAHTDLGNAIDNSIVVKSGTVGNAYSGYSSLGDVWENVFTFDGGTLNSITAGYTVLGESWGNLVNLTAETGTINGDVSGGYSVSAGGVARDNQVVIDFGGTSNGMISGGRSDFGDTRGNTVILESGNVSGMTGGRSDHGRTTDNSVLIEGGFAQTVYGGYTVDGIVENNTVTINGSTAIVGTVAGGFNDLGHVSDNRVTIENVKGVTSIYGGQSNQGDALSNLITVENGNFTGGTLSGGGSMVSGNATDNQVVINGGIGVVDNAYGGTAIDGDVTENHVFISTNTLNIATATGGYSSEGMSSNNTVTVEGGRIANAYGGASGFGDAAYNDVNVIDSSLRGGTITGGASRESGNAHNNSVLIEGNSSGDAGNIYGGWTKLGDAADNDIDINNGSAGAGTVAGGYSESGTATGNDVRISSSGEFSSIYGGIAGEGDTVGNTVEISNSGVRNVYGSYTESGNAAGTVMITGGRFNGGTVAGAYTEADGNADSNDVTITDASAASGVTSVYGGHAAVGTANDNSVSISGNAFSGATIAGGYSEFGAATGNSVDVTGSTVRNVYGSYADSGDAAGIVAIASGQFAGGTIAGAYSAAGGNADGNSVSITDARAASGTTHVYGGYAGDGSANHNAVVVEGNAFSGGTIAGGYSALGAATGNSVGVTGGTVRNVYGSYAGHGSATGTVEITDGQFAGGTIAGAYSLAAGSADGNTVAITGARGAMGTTHVYGGYAAEGSADGNSVSITGSAFSGGTVAGGYSESGSAGNNSLVIDSNGTFGSAYGGRAGNGAASGNWLELAAGRYSGTIAGGYSLSGSATGNTVTIGEGAILNAGVLLYGGWSGNGMDSRSGNTLNLRSPVSVRGLDNFENYNFIGPPEMVAGDTLVTVTAGNGEGEPVHLGGTQVMVGLEQPNTNLKAGDSIVLIDERGGFGFDGSPANTTSNGATVGLLDYEFDLSVVQDQLLASITEARGSEAATSLSEGFVSGVVLNNLGADAIAGPAMDSALSSVHAGAKTGLGGFGSLVAGKSRYKTGSYVDMLGVSAAAGLAYGINYDERYITMGPFLEYGKGDYDTLNQDGEREIRGSGDSEYMGGGFLLRWDEKDAGMGRYFAEASFRVGRLTNDFSSSDIHPESEQPTSYDSSAVYYGMHFGYGGAWKLGDRTGLDVYGKYFYSRGESDAVALSSGEPIRFDEVTSHRLRGGARLSLRAGQRTTLLFGGAYEHQLDGWVDATVASYVIDAPTLKGGTGIGEFILSYKPSATGQTSINVGVQGFGGKREGVAGNIFVRF